MIENLSSSIFLDRIENAVSGDGSLAAGGDNLAETIRAISNITGCPNMFPTGALVGFDFDLTLGIRF